MLVCTSVSVEASRPSETSESAPPPVRPPTAIKAVPLLMPSAPERPVSVVGGATGIHWRGVQADEPASEK